MLLCIGEIVSSETFQISRSQSVGYVLCGLATYTQMKSHRTVIINMDVVAYNFLINLTNKRSTDAR